MKLDYLAALYIQEAAHVVCGFSAEGRICRRPPLTCTAIRKAALYEPALIVDGSMSTAFLARYDREMAEGNVAAALVTGMLASQMGPPIFNAMPRWLLESFTRSAMKSEEKKAKSGDVMMRLLAPTLHYEFQLVKEMAETLEHFRAVQTEVLLLGGSKSPAYLTSALDALEKVLPHVQRIEFPGLNHGGSSDASSTNRGGKPEQVAQALRPLFA